jgi:NAD(P)-dependent dehydrogenase (short-subunit alcohol dehydrogenase family)
MKLQDAIVLITGANRGIGQVTPEVVDPLAQYACVRSRPSRSGRSILCCDEVHNVAPRSPLVRLPQAPAITMPRYA